MTFSWGPYCYCWAHHFLPKCNNIWIIYWSLCLLLLPHLAGYQQSRQGDPVQNAVRTCLSFAGNLPDGCLSQIRSQSPPREPPGIWGPPLTLPLCSSFSSYTSGSWPCSSSLECLSPQISKSPHVFKSPFLRIFAQMLLFPRRPSHLISNGGSLPSSIPCLSSLLHVFPLYFST